MCPFHDDFSHFFRMYQNREVARCYHGYCSYAPLSDIVKHQNQCTIPSSSRICIQISFTYPALPNCHFQILPLYYNDVIRTQQSASEATLQYLSLFISPLSMLYLQKFLLIHLKKCVFYIIYKLLELPLRVSFNDFNGLHY